MEERPFSYSSLCLAGNYVSPCSPVHAGFEKFCIPMGCRRKTEFSRSTAVCMCIGAPNPPLEQRKMQDA
jgi:hypothetical protein